MTEYYKVEICKNCWMEAKRRITPSGGRCNVCGDNKAETITHVADMSGDCTLEEAQKIIKENERLREDYNVK